MIQGLRIVCRDGSAPSQDEIDAAHRVVATFGPRFTGVIPITDDPTGCLVEYHAHKNLAIVDSISDYRLAALPCPWAPRSVVVEAIRDQFGVATGVSICLSDGTLISDFLYDPFVKEFSVKTWVAAPTVVIRDKYPPYGADQIYPLSPFPSDVLDAEWDYATSSSQWTDNDLSYRQALLDRRIAWSHSMTTNTVDAPLVTNGLWPSWDWVIKLLHPSSEHLARDFGPTDIPLAETITDTQDPPGTIFDGVGTYRIQRDYVISFRITDQNGTTTDLSLSGSGSLTMTSQMQSGVSYKSYVYDNWYMPADPNAAEIPVPFWLRSSAANASTFMPRLSDQFVYRQIGYPPHTDPQSYAYKTTQGSLWNGSIILNDRPSASSDNVLWALYSAHVNYPLPADSYFNLPWGEILRNRYALQNSLSWTLPPIIQEYYRLLPVSWHSTPIASEASHIFKAPESCLFIDVILFSQISNGRNLGMYWMSSWSIDYNYGAPSLPIHDYTAEPTPMIDGVEVEGVFRIKWDAALSRFTPVKDLEKPLNPVRIVFQNPLPRIPTNAILRFAAPKYRDMRDNARTLRKCLKETDPTRRVGFTDFLGGWRANGTDTAYAIVAGILSELGDL